MSPTVVILTGCELRHRFVRKALASLAEVRVVASICEDLDGSLVSRVAQKVESSTSQSTHLASRAQTEKDFFGWFDDCVADKSNPIDIPRSSINDPEVIEQIRGLAPDLIVSYGCSILREPFLDAFRDRILNVHLGLSPYYRGGGTNFWPLVNREPEFVGVTFMRIDAGIDTGEIIHQMRGRILPHDNVHQIGNRIISDMVPVLSRLASNYAQIPRMPQPLDIPGKTYRMRDLTEDAVDTLYKNFDAGLVADYLRDRVRREEVAPIVENPAMKS